MFNRYLRLKAHVELCLQANKAYEGYRSISQSKGTSISFEILPPLKGKTINSIYDHLDPLMEFKPIYINVTYHRSRARVQEKEADGVFEKVEVRRDRELWAFAPPS
jgi:hypothetical protein